MIFSFNFCSVFLLGWVPFAFPINFYYFNKPQPISSQTNTWLSIFIKFLNSSIFLLLFLFLLFILFFLLFLLSLWLPLSLSFNHFLFHCLFHYFVCISSWFYSYAELTLIFGLFYFIWWTSWGFWTWFSLVWISRVWNLTWAPTWVFWSRTIAAFCLWWVWASLWRFSLAAWFFTWVFLASRFFRWAFLWPHFWWILFAFTRLGRILGTLRLAPLNFIRLFLAYNLIRFLFIRLGNFSQLLISCCGH